MLLSSNRRIINVCMYDDDDDDNDDKVPKPDFKS